MVHVLKGYYENSKFSEMAEHCLPLSNREIIKS